MITNEITRDNLNKYSPFLDEEEAENIGRDYFRGIAVEDEDGEFKAGVIWELKDSENDEQDTSSELKWIHASGEESGGELFDEYFCYTLDDNVSESRFEFVTEECKKEEDLLAANGFQTGEAESRMLVVTVADLGGLTSMKLNKRIPSYIHPLSELPEKDFRRGIMNCIFHSRRSLMEDLNTLPMNWYEKDISCYVETDGRVDGFLLVHKMTSGRLRVELFVNVGPDQRVELFNMARFSIKETIQRYDGNTQVILWRRDQATTDLTAFLFPGFKGPDALVGNRWE